MKTAAAYSLVVFASFALLADGASRWRDAAPNVIDDAPTIDPVRGAGGADSLEGVLADAEDMIVSNDPFRLANVPAPTRYDPKFDGVSVAGAAVSLPALRPNMTLKAIVGGPPWQAVVDGLPGQPPGTVVRVGAAFDRVIARAVTRDSVVLQGPDTTWVLSFRRQP